LEVTVWMVGYLIIMALSIVVLAFWARKAKRVEHDISYTSDGEGGNLRTPYGQKFLNIVTFRDR
jgi:hypothetical protein